MTLNERPDYIQGRWENDSVIEINRLNHGNLIKRNEVKHYTDGGIETIDYIRAKQSNEQFLGFCLGNVMKYISRAGKKGSVYTDLIKAKDYLDWAINIYEKTGDENNIEG